MLGLDVIIKKNKRTKMLLDECNLIYKNLSIRDDVIDNSRCNEYKDYNNYDKKNIIPKKRKWSEIDE
jgi:hypothetical protein